MGHGSAAVEGKDLAHQSCKVVEVEPCPVRRKEKVQDGLHTAIFIYFLCGNAVLLPWNAFITAVDYFGSTYPGMHTDRLFTVCYLPFTFFFLVLLTLLHNHRRARTCVLVSFGAFFVSVLAVPLIDAGTHGQGSSGSLAAICCLLMVAGITDALGQGALYGSASALGPRVVEGLVAGTASSGIVVSLLRIITKAAYNDSREGLRIAAAVYFGVAAIFVLVCFLLFGWVLPRLPCIREQERAARDAPDAQLADCELGSGCQDGKPGARTVREMVRGVGVLAAATVLIYVLTLAIFPGVLAEDVSSTKLGSWYPVILIMIYNIGDFIGKMTPMVFPASSVTAPVTIFASAAVRLAFVPAFFFAARSGVAPLVMVLTALLGISNGLVTVWAFIAAPAACTTAKLKHLAGNVMITCLVLGLLLGSGCSFLWLIGRGW